MRRLAGLVGVLLVLGTGSVLAAPPPAVAPTSSATAVASAPTPDPTLTPAELGYWPQPTLVLPTSEPFRQIGPTPQPTSTVEDAKRWAQDNLSNDEWVALYWIVWSESKWAPTAINARSGACGLGQFWPCSKMSDSLPDWRVQPLRQLQEYVIPYAVKRYGGLCQAWAAWQRQGWW